MSLHMSVSSEFKVKVADDVSAKMTGNSLYPSCSKLVILIRGSFYRNLSGVDGNVSFTYTNATIIKMLTLLSNVSWFLEKAHRKRRPLFASYRSNRER